MAAKRKGATIGARVGALVAPKAGKAVGSTGRKIGRIEGRLAAGKTASKAAAKAGKGQAGLAGKLLKFGGSSSSGGPSAGRLGARLAPKAGRAGGRAGRAGAKAAYRAGKARSNIANQISGSRESGGSRYLKYGLFTIAGLAIGALVGRSGGDSGNGDSSGSTGPHTPDPGSPAGQRGETWGSGTPLGSAGGGGSGSVTGASSGTGYQRTEDENRTGADRDYSDPSSGPLIGEGHRPESDIGTGQQEEVEQRIRTRIGEDSRTEDMPRINVEVNEGVAELRGVAPTVAAKDAAGEIAAGVEGVNEVRNLIEVGS